MMSQYPPEGKLTNSSPIHPQHIVVTSKPRSLPRTNLTAESNMKISLAKALLVASLFCAGFTPSRATAKVVDVTAEEYFDIDGFQLVGYKATPTLAVDEIVPAVVIVPDWDGVNAYEQQRASMLADLGYVSFAADIFGIDDQEVETMERRIELTTLYRSNVTLFIQRIKAAINLVKSFEGVDPDNVAVIGYCFGGSGVLVSTMVASSNQYAMKGSET